MSTDDKLESFDGKLRLTLVFGWCYIVGAYYAMEFADKSFWGAVIIFLGSPVSAIALPPIFDIFVRDWSPPHTLVAWGGILAAIVISHTLFLILCSGVVIARKLGLIQETTGSTEQGSYEALISVSGCGPAIAVRILNKIEAGSALTKREKQIMREAGL